MGMKILNKNLGKRESVFNKFHKKITTEFPEMNWREFPIYVIYFIDELVLAIVYFRGDNISDKEIDVGFNINKKPNDNFVDAKYMNYKGINYSIKIEDKKNSLNQVEKAFKIIKNNEI